MKVRAKLFASLREGRFEEAELELPEGGRVADLIAAAGLGPEEVRIVFRNARHAAPEEELADGDLLSLFPPVGGG